MERMVRYTLEEWADYQEVTEEEITEPDLLYIIESEDGDVYGVYEAEPHNIIKELD